MASKSKSKSTTRKKVRRSPSSSSPQPIPDPPKSSPKVATKSVALRGGNSGAVDEAGKVYGKCHRLSHLRQEGREDEPSASTILLFEAGFANEDCVLAELKTKYPDKHYLREEEIPISWTTANGTPVTGRPDIVEVDVKGNPVHGFELKQLASIWSARKRALKNLPDMNHVVQSAHYSWQLGVPYTLWYTNRVYFHIPYAEWFRREARGTRFVDHDESGEPWRMIPFHKKFELEWINDTLWLSSDGLESMETVITKDSIRRYYDRVSEMKELQDLGPRPEAVTIFGERDKKSSCDYCPFKAICDTPDLTYTEFMRRAHYGSKEK